MSAEQRLQELGLTLPEVPSPVASYVNSVRTGKLIHLSGGLPFDGNRRFEGKVPFDLTLEQAQEASRVAILNRLTVLREEAGTLDKVKQIVSLQGFVNSAPDFYDHPKVINGASELLLDIFGARGRHTRVALGVSALPLNAAVEISMIAELD